MRFPTLSLTVLAGLTAAAVPLPVLAQGEPSREEKPITQRDPSAVDVVATPANDLNLRKGEIPPLLLAAQTDPYGLRGMRKCSDISSAVQHLDGVLGDDIDIAQAPGNKMSAGRVAQSVVGSFIPFRGIIREISGANEQERKLQAAIYAGTARRSFLRGVGMQRGCAWPARPATPQMLAKIAEANEAKAREEAAKASEKRR